MNTCRPKQTRPINTGRVSISYTVRRTEHAQQPGLSFYLGRPETLRHWKRSKLDTLNWEQMLRRFVRASCLIPAKWTLARSGDPGVTLLDSSPGCSTSVFTGWTRSLIHCLSILRSWEKQRNRTAGHYTATIKDEASGRSPLSAGLPYGGRLHPPLIFTLIRCDSIARANISVSVREDIQRSCPTRRFP